MKTKFNYIQIKNYDEGISKVVDLKNKYNGLVNILTIECEFGNKIVPGYTCYDGGCTFGHHVEGTNKECSTCEQVYSLIDFLNYIDYGDGNCYSGSTLPVYILFNVLDLDSMLSIYCLEKMLECRYTDKIGYLYKFITSAGLSDRLGVHKLDRSEKTSQMVLAYHTWANECKLKFESDFMVQLQKGLDFIDSMYDNESIISEYYSKEIGRKKEVESMLVEENNNGRIFNTSGIFCGADYEEKKFIVAFNQKFKTVTLSFEDGGKQFNAVKIMQSMFGSEAGGHLGIAGTPRGKEFSFEDIKLLFKKMNSLYNEVIKC